jgi:hypothetical protein
MKRLLALLLLASPLFGAYGFRRSVTINAATITGTLANYPMAFGGTLAYLATVANGGNVQNANGYDIAFFSDSAGTTPLSCEQESYNAATGAVQYWVKIPSAAVGTVIYLFYGDSSVSTAQCGATGTWDTNESLVMHMGSVSGLLADSTAQNTVTNHSATATSTNCSFDGCGAFASSGPQYFTVANTASIELGTNMTLEVWPSTTLTPSCSGGSCNQVWYDKRNTGGTGRGYLLAYNCQNPGTCSSNLVEFLLKGASTSSDTYWSNFTRSTIQYVAATYDGSNMKVYINGAPASLVSGTTAVVIGSTDDATATLNIGTVQGIGANANGSLDEMRVSNTARTAAWFEAIQHNFNIGGGFYTIGSAVTLNNFVANPSVFGIAVQ